MGKIITLVYIAGRFSHCDRNDLRYSLRSLEKFGIGIDRVFVVGDKVHWLSDEVINVEFKQPHQRAVTFREKHTNLQETLRFIADNLDVGDEFIYSSDDHYLTCPIDFSDYPYYMKLTDNGCELPLASAAPYGKSLVSTRKFLESNGLPTKYMTLHRNMKLKVSAIKDCAPLFDEIFENKLSVEPFALLGNYMIQNCGVVPLPKKDYKINKGSEWWKASPSVTDTYSTTELHYGWLDNLLLSEYPKKSKYEK